MGSRRDHVHTSLWIPTIPKVSGSLAMHDVRPRPLLGVGPSGLLRVVLL